MSSVDALFHRKLVDKINAAMAAKEAEILGGYMGDSSLVAMNYRAGVGYCRALLEVIDMCEQVEQEFMGGSA